MMRAKSSMDAEYCMALGARELRDAAGIETVEAADSGLRDHDAGGIDAEIVAAVDQSGHAVHQDMVALRGHDIEDDVPALAGLIAGPVVVPDNHAAVLGVAAGGHEGAAMLGRGRGRGKVVLLGVPFIEIRHL